MPALAGAGEPGREMLARGSLAEAEAELAAEMEAPYTWSRAAALGVVLLYTRQQWCARAYYALVFLAE